MEGCWSIHAKFKVKTSTSKRKVDVGLKREYSWTFIVADVKQPILGADFSIHYNLLVDLSGRCLRDMRTGLAISATLSSIKLLSLNRIDNTRNEYTGLLNQFPELTRPTTKGKTVKHGKTHKRSSRFRATMKISARQISHREERARRNDQIGRYRAERQRMVFSTTHGPQKKRRLATMRRLPQFKCSDGTR